MSSDGFVNIVKISDSVELCITNWHDLTFSNLTVNMNESLDEILVRIRESYSFESTVIFTLCYMSANSSWQDRLSIVTIEEMHLAICSYFAIDKHVSQYCWFITGQFTPTNSDTVTDKFRLTLPLLAFVSNVSLIRLVNCDAKITAQSFEECSSSDTDATMMFITDVLTRDDDICVFCGDTNHVQAVHILKWYQICVGIEFAPVEYQDVRNGISLCESCQQLFEQRTVDVALNQDGQPVIRADIQYSPSCSLYDGKLLRFPVNEVQQAKWPEYNVFSFRNKWRDGTMLQFDFDQSTNKEKTASHYIKIKVSICRCCVDNIQSGFRFLRSSFRLMFLDNGFYGCKVGAVAV